LADETINRVTKRLKEIEADFTGDRARYFYGVASKVHLEYLRKPPSAAFDSLAGARLDDAAGTTVIDREESRETERDYECLDRCMQALTPNNRELMLQYYQEEKQAKIDHRKELAIHLGIALNALRIRAHRIRASLQECVQNCVNAANA
jgi:DNA-directed RNA polymerase specialized sigma24 family protein